MDVAKRIGSAKSVGIAEDGAIGRVVVNPAAFRIEQHNQVGDILRDLLKMRLTLEQLALHFFAPRVIPRLRQRAFDRGNQPDAPVFQHIIDRSIAKRFDRHLFSNRA
jgi:hypothetical protein